MKDANGAVRHEINDRRLKREIPISVGRNIPPRRGDTVRVGNVSHQERRSQLRRRRSPASL